MSTAYFLPAAQGRGGQVAHEVRMKPVHNEDVLCESLTWGGRAQRYRIDFVAPYALEGIGISLPLIGFTNIDPTYIHVCTVFACLTR